MPWSDTASIALYEMNAAFHEGLAAASGNRYLLVAVQQQNRLRRFSSSISKPLERAKCPFR